MTGTNLATIKEPRIRAKYCSSERENVSGAGWGWGQSTKRNNIACVQRRAESAPFASRCDGLERLRSRGCCPKERHQYLCRASSEVLSGGG